MTKRRTNVVSKPILKWVKDSFTLYLYQNTEKERVCYYRIKKDREKLYQSM